MSTCAEAAGISDWSFHVYCGVLLWKGLVLQGPARVVGQSSKVSPRGAFVKYQSINTGGDSQNIQYFCFHLSSPELSNQAVVTRLGDFVSAYPFV